MAGIAEVRVVDAESMADGIMVTFGDGRCAFYSAALLHEMFARAEQHETSQDDLPG